MENEYEAMKGNGLRGSVSRTTGPVVRRNGLRGTISRTTGPVVRRNGLKGTVSRTTGPVVRRNGLAARSTVIEPPLLDEGGVGGVQGDFLLDIDVDITCQMHADKFFELGEPIVEQGTRADHNVAIISNLFDFKFNDLPDDILDALDDMKNTINERYGAGTVETREDVLQFVGVDAVRNALDGMSVGLPRSLDGDDLRTVMEDLLKAKGLA